MEKAPPRLIAALTLGTHALADAVINITNLAKNAMPGFPITPPQALHLTLHYFGAKPTGSQFRQVRDTFSQLPPLPEDPLPLDRIELFDRGALVLTMAPEALPSSWEHAIQELRKIFRPFTEEERVYSFRPHITLGTVPESHRTVPPSSAASSPLLFIGNPIQVERRHTYFILLETTGDPNDPLKPVPLI